MYLVNNSEQLRELSSNDLNFLEDNPIEIEPASGEDGNSNSTVRDLENILDKFEADAQLLLDNPNQLLNCKYPELEAPFSSLLKAAKVPADVSKIIVVVRFCKISASAE